MALADLQKDSSKIQVRLGCRMSSFLNSPPFLQTRKNTEGTGLGGHVTQGKVWKLYSPAHKN